MVSTIVRQKLVATGNTVYGQLVTVHENEYSEEIPGVGNSSFSVSVSGTRDHAAHTAGFQSLKDVKRYLHSASDEVFTTHDRGGNEVQETRRGLGIPTGMVSEFSDGETVNVDAPTNPERVPVDANVGDRQSTAPVQTDNVIKEEPAKNAKDSKAKESKNSNANKNG